jgi:hypothetical protein
VLGPLPEARRRKSDDTSITDDGPPTQPQPVASDGPSTAVEDGPPTTANKSADATDPGARPPTTKGLHAQLTAPLPVAEADPTPLEGQLPDVTAPLPIVAAARPPSPSKAELRAAPVPRRSASRSDVARAAVQPPSADAEPPPPTAEGPEHPAGWKNPKWAKWYEAAGALRNSQRLEASLDGDGEGEGLSLSARLPKARLDPAVVVLGVAASAEAAALLIGANVTVALGVIVASGAAFLLWRGYAIGRIAAWLFAGWALCFALVQLAVLRLPVQALLHVLLGAALAGVLRFEGRKRQLSAVAGVVIGLLTLVPVIHARQATESRASGIAADGSVFTDPIYAVGLTAPEGIALVGPVEAREFLPSALISSVTPRVGFVNDDGTLVGGLVVVQQVTGSALTNRLALVNVANETAERNDDLLPASLKRLSGEGWQLPSAGGDTMMVVLCRASDGRAFILFGITNPALRARNRQLFVSVAEGMKVFKKVATTAQQ